MKTLQDVDNHLEGQRGDDFADELFAVLHKYMGADKELAITVIMGTFITGCVSSGLSSDQTKEALATALEEYFYDPTVN